jgi:dihydroorotase
VDSEKEMRLFRGVKQLNVVTGEEHTVEVLIENDRILAIGPTLTDIPPTATVESKGEWILAPGLVDLYGYSSEPGFEERETIASLLKSAKAGGFARINILPDTQPPIDSAATISLLQSSIKKERSSTPHLPTVGIWSALTQNNTGDQLAEVRELAAAGAIGFTAKIDLANLPLLRRSREYLQHQPQPIAIQAEASNLNGGGIAREGTLALRYGFPPLPTASETTAIAAILELIRSTPAPLHFMRLSTARGVELIRHAKQAGLPITASIVWLHAIADIRDLATYDPNLRLSPPLGNPSDREAIIAGLQDGTIDAIATDDRAYTYEEKMVPFGEAPPGTLGRQFILPLLWQNLVATNLLTPHQLWRTLSTHPAAILQTPTPETLILFDPHLPWQVDRTTLHSLSQNTHYWGKTILGKPIAFSIGGA